MLEPLYFSSFLPLSLIYVVTIAEECESFLG